MLSKRRRRKYIFNRQVHKTEVFICRKTIKYFILNTKIIHKQSYTLTYLILLPTYMQEIRKE